VVVVVSPAVVVVEPEVSLSSSSPPLVRAKAAPPMASTATRAITAMRTVFGPFLAGCPGGMPPPE
jgi:hypothetical protein